MTLRETNSWINERNVNKIVILLKNKCIIDDIDQIINNPSIFYIKNTKELIEKCLSCKKEKCDIKI